MKQLLELCHGSIIVVYFKKHVIIQKGGKKMEINERIMKNGFMNHNHFSLVERTENESSILKVELEDIALNPFGFAHGGLIFGLGDTAMGILANTKDKQAVTLSSTIHYLRPATGKYLLAKAKMVKNGKKVCYLTVDIINDKEKLVATMEGNYYYVD